MNYYFHSLLKLGKFNQQIYMFIFSLKKMFIEGVLKNECYLHHSCWLEICCSDCHS
jgi:hypothetical protein